MDQELLVWIILAALFVVTELATVAFVALYLALGSVAAAIVAYGGGDLAWQLAAFVVASIVLLLLTRPVLKSRLEGEDIPTNVHQLVGKVGIVTITIDEQVSTGQIRIGTEYWTARLAEDVDHGVSMVPVDARVTVVAVSGVTARVVPFQASAAAPTAVPGIAPVPTPAPEQA